MKNRLFILLLIASFPNFISAQTDVKSDDAKGSITDEISLDTLFSFAQLTDVHIDMRNPQNSADLRAAVADVNKQPGIAFAIVSGDIAETGDYVALCEAKQILDGLDCKYYIIPGNHDTKWSESGATDFKRIFGNDKFRMQMHDFFFLGINSGPIIKMGDGHISPQDIDWVERQLKNVGKRMPVIFVTHYPLKNGDVDNWWMLTDVLRKYNVQCVIGGHYHTNKKYSYDGIPAVLCRSTLRGNDSVGGYAIYHMREDSLFVNEKIVGKPQVQWASFPIETKFYVEGNTKEFPRADYSVNDKYKNVRDIWVKEIGYGIYGTPAVEGDNMYFGDDKGRFHCFSLNKGKQIWKYDAFARIASTPMISDGKVVFGSCDRNIYCLSIENGKLLWKHTVNNAVLGSPLIEDGIVYIGASDGKFRALSLDDGKEIWTFDELKNYQESRPVIVGNKVIFGAWDSYLYALNKNTGALEWKWNNGRLVPHFSPAAVWPVVAFGKVFITAPDRFMTAIDVETGETVWRTKAHKVRETIGLSNDNKIVFSRCMNDSVLAVSAEANECELLWKVDAQFGYDHNPSMLIERNGHIVFATKNGEINCINSIDGKILWKHKIGNSIINTMVPISDTDWVLTTTDGVVARISAK